MSAQIADKRIPIIAEINFARRIEKKTSPWILSTRGTLRVCLKHSLASVLGYPETILD